LPIGSPVATIGGRLKLATSFRKLPVRQQTFRIAARQYFVAAREVHMAFTLDISSADHQARIAGGMALFRILCAFPE